MLAVLLGGSAVSVPAAGAAPNDINVQVGAASVELSVATPHAFRMRIVYPVAANPKMPGPDSAIYFGPPPAGPRPAAKKIADAATVGLTTDFGTLQVDPAAKTWRLLDAGGKVLADWASIGGPLPCEVAVGASPDHPHPLYYGAGTVPERGSLTQTQSGVMANGTAALPQFWSSTGFGVLMAGPYGDHPGTWKSNGAGGVDLRIPGASTDLYLAPAPTLYDWLRADAEITGFAPTPPLWAFGYLQSRWGWTDRRYIEDTLAHFRADRLPVDAFIIDFEWYTTHHDYAVPPQGEADFIDFGWNPALFPDPAAQIASYHRQGIQVIGIRKPRLGNAAAVAAARAKGWILTPNPADPNRGGPVARNLDFSIPAVRAFWAENNRRFIDAGMAGFWNDEGETRFTEYSGWNLAETGLLRRARPHARFWSLNRSFAPGMQRFGAAFWTGDIHADWPTLAQTPGELLAAGLAGMPYAGCDIGGYAGTPEPELLVRWMEAGVFFPVMRAHSYVNDTPHFPWLYGPDAKAAMRKALELRYRLLPYYYSLARETAKTGAPLMRPLAMEFAGQPQVTDEWLMGRGLLAAPVLVPGGKRVVSLPQDHWYELGSNRSIAGPADIPVTAALDQIPVYVRAGTLLPLGPVLQHTGEPTDQPLELQIYPGRNAVFTLVEDDGATRDGPQRLTTFTWDDAARRLTWHVAGAYAGANVFARMRAVLFAPGGAAAREGKLGGAGELVW
ncbi:MAG: TIM-barrel domain-containing protein [Verrucomicrobiota bacterium]